MKKTILVFIFSLSICSYSQIPISQTYQHAIDYLQGKRPVFAETEYEMQGLDTLIHINASEKDKAVRGYILKSPNGTIGMPLVTEFLTLEAAQKCVKDIMAIVKTKFPDLVVTSGAEAEKLVKKQENRISVDLLYSLGLMSTLTISTFTPKEGPTQYSLYCMISWMKF